MIDTIKHEIANKFKIEGMIKEVKEYGSGLINNTYLVVTNKNKYIFQIINNNVFKNPDKLMKNIELVTNYLKIKNGTTIKLIKTDDDKNYLFYENKYYRCYEMKQNYISYEKIPNLKIALETGKTIANFQYLLNDFDIKLLDVTIPFFHDLRHRYIDLIIAFRNSNDILKKNECKKIIKEIIKEYENVMKLPILIERGLIGKRVCHYDTKLNNFLFSEKDEIKSCLIDLDTVMPGCSLYDYGDNIRNTIVSVMEDEYEKDVVIDYEKFINITIGYLSIGKNYLTKKEIENLINGIKVIVIELSIRFLTDYLNDNIYFKINCEKHNLYRSICQLNIYKKIKCEEKKFKKLVDEVCGRII